ncbi:hypothetical protein ZIOFF_024287 [Zingiber officinale]|uniref:Uncharacterized protein n=1 Tax=Zingiber officinale TaxID=94328 RepID=A0A8J5HBU2_ZINOF|nr:hypothetical protein ZIOFF_024287 [Zingiber officinale]
MRGGRCLTRQSVHKRLHTRGSKQWPVVRQRHRYLLLKLSCFSISIYWLKIVVAAVGFKARRPEIPSTVNRHVAAIIESCWASANEAAASFHCITANTIDQSAIDIFQKEHKPFEVVLQFQSDISMELVYCQHGTCISTKSILAYEIWKMASEFTNLKYSIVEIDEVRFEWAECMLD